MDAEREDAERDRLARVVPDEHPNPAAPPASVATGRPSVGAAATIAARQERIATLRRPLKWRMRFDRRTSGDTSPSSEKLYGSEGRNSTVAGPTRSRSV